MNGRVPTGRRVVTGRRAAVEKTRRRGCDGAEPTGLPHPRVLLTRREAAAALGVSLSHFQRHVQASVPCVYSGQLRLYRPIDLERWAEREASQ